MLPAGNDIDGGMGGPNGLTVELFVNNAWTDISPFVRYTARVKITRGKPNETSQVQPQTCTFTISNKDGRFSPRNPLGPYYGTIGRNTPVRVSRLQNGVRRFRFHGEVPSWPTTYDTSGNDVTAVVTAAGQLRRLTQGNLPLHSTLYRAYAQGFSDALAPVAYWPCEDGSSATSIAAGLPGVSAMAVSGQANATFASNTSFVCSAALPLLSASIWTGAVPAYTGGTDNVLRFLLFVPLTGAYDTAVLARMYTGGTVAKVDLQYGVGSNGSLNLTGYDSAGTQLFTTGYTALSVGGYTGGFNGLPVMVSVELQASGSSVLYAVAFMPLLAVAGSFGLSFTLSFGFQSSASIGNATQVVVNPDGHINDTAVGHIAYQSKYDILGNVSEQLNAWLIDSPFNRFARLCSEQGVPAIAIRATGVNAADPTSMGYQLIDTFTNLVQEPTNATGALLFESREQAVLVMRERSSLYNQAATLTLDHSQHQLSGPLVPVDDDALTRNDVTVQRVNGSSNQQVLTVGTLSNQPPPNGVGDYPTSVSISLGSDSLLADQAGWRLHLGTVDQPRYPSIPVNLRHSTFTGNLDMMNAVLTIDIGDRLVVTNPPGWEPPDPVSQIVQGYSETMGVFEHDMVFNCSPEDPYRVGLLDDVVLGHVDTDGSTLLQAVTATATTLSVATTNATSPAWTTSGGDFPFDIAVGGERMTVTNITTPAVTLGVDGTFESGVAGWTIGTGSALASSIAAAHTGSHSGLASGPGTTVLSITTPSIAVTPGVGYALTLWMMHQAGTIDQAAARIVWLDGASNIISQLDSASSAASSSWTSLTVAQTAPGGAAFIQAQFHAHTPGADAVYIDDVTLTAGLQTFTATRSMNGVVKAQAAGTDVRLWQPMYTSL
jgi:hypothetical protein